MTNSPPAREPSRLFLQLLPCFALAVAVTVLFCWGPFGRPPRKAYFEALVQSGKPGTAAFASDIDGMGPRAGQADPVSYPGGGVVSRVRFAMVAGKLCSVSFCPRDDEGETDVLACLVRSEAGEVLAALSPADLAGINPKFAELRPNGALRFHSRVDEEVNALQFRPAPPIELAVELPLPWWQPVIVFTLSLAGALGLSWAWGDRAAALRWFPAMARWAAEHPLRTLFFAACFSVALGCYPVIFCGKSFVSPDNGLLLLYKGQPTAPGSGSRVDNGVGSDLGATMLWALPVSMIEHRAIFQDHEFPLWNRYNWCGLTLFGQSLSMIGDPLDWPVILTGGAPWAWDWKFVTAQLLFALAIGLIVRRTSGSLPAALLLTLSAPFMGFFAYRYNHAAFFSLCYSPWILLAWTEAKHARTVRGAALWAFFLIFANWWELNSGTAKEMSALLLFLNAAGGLMLLLAPEPLRWRVQRLAVFAWASLLFLLLSAPVWMVFLDALGKAFTSYDVPRIYQMNPGIAIGLFDDIFYRQLMPDEFLFNPSANFFVLIGVAWALVRARALAGERALWAVTLPALVAGVLAFGVVSPATAAAIPFLNNIYHFDNTFSCVLFILMFVVAGFGLRECLARMRDPEWCADWLLMLTFVGLLVASYFGFTQAAHRVGKTFLKVGETIPKSPFFSDYVPALLVALAIFPWAWRQVWLRRPATAAWAVVALCAFATLHFRHGMYLQTKFDFYTRNPQARTDLRHLTSPALECVRAAATEPARVVGLDWEMTPGFSAALGFETISGPDALMNPMMVSLVDTLGLKRTWDWRVKVREEDYAGVHRALDMLNVRYLFDSPEHHGQSLPGTRVLGASDLTVLESPTAWPRAFFTDTVGVYGSGLELRRFVEQGDGRPFAAQPPEFREKLPEVAPRDLASRVVAPAHHYQLTNNTTSFEIDAPKPGVAVLMEANTPGDILAFVDDQPAPCLAMNQAFRGVFIAKPGHHVVKFAYWPGVLDSALILAEVGLTALALSLFLWWRKRPILSTPPPAETALPACATVP